MSHSEAANKSAKKIPESRGESPASMEPLLISASSSHRGKLTDLVVELTAKSTGLSKSLAPAISKALATLVRSLNCYYSNLIEGHDTHPVDIERALNEDFSADPEQRDLQLEAKAHIEVQKWIDEGGLDGRACSEEGILETHRRFCELLPPDLLKVANPDTGEELQVTAGQYRDRGVKVGRHVPISPGAIPAFMARFEAVYTKLGRTDQIMAASSAHHRLLWIHPFLDGNGRVARLISYAMLREGLKTQGLWSVARGLARNEAQYKQHLNNCDLPRRNDLDGRGNLSEEALAEFTEFFLKTCIDQVEFIEGLVEPERLRTRVLVWAEEEMRLGQLTKGSDTVLKVLLQDGEVERARLPEILSASDRSARRVTSALIERAVVNSASTRAPLKLNLSAEMAERWLPGLFPGKK
jgi:Fic family protein